MIDTHFHVFDAGQGLPGSRYVPAYAANFEAWSEAAARSGVTRGVLVQTSFLGTDVSRLLHELAAHPQRLRGVAAATPATSVAELAYWHALGVRGIRLNLAGQPTDGAAWRGAGRWWDALLDLGWHVELHTDAGALPSVLDWLPRELPLVIDHMAKPLEVHPRDATVRALRRRAACVPVHVKLSGAYRLQGRDPVALARLWRAELGVNRLLWGSDWPCTNHEVHADYPRLAAALGEWLSHDDLAVVGELNPQRLYGFPAAAAFDSAG